MNDSERYFIDHPSVWDNYYLGPFEDSLLQDELVVFNGSSKSPGLQWLRTYEL